MSAPFVPSPGQAAGIASIVEWFKAHRAGTTEKPFFYLAGYAGTGKSTCLDHALGELGLAQFDGSHGALTMAYTGKATRVLQRKGVAAQTIHSALYRVSEPTKEEIERCRKELEEALAAMRQAGSEAERVIAQGRAATLELRLRNSHKPQFVLNTESIIKEADLVVLDECSMVDETIGNHILSFGKPVLALGDPGQLPPIGGEGFFTRGTPDAFLTEIHRQAGESAILRLATAARQGQPIRYGQHDEFVWKMRRHEVQPQQLVRAGQVIVAKNATRRTVNMAMRGALGFTGFYPTGPDEKIICLKNRNDLGIVNGLFLTLSALEDHDQWTFSAVVHDEDGRLVGGCGDEGQPLRQLVYKGHFEDHFRYDDDRGRRDHSVKRNRNLIEADFANAITCHKSQGSQYENIVVMDEGFGRTAEDQNRWLYTAITRAERGLVLLS